MNVRDWVVLGLGIIVSILSGLIARLLSKLDDLEEAKEKLSREMRDTRAAIARLEGSHTPPLTPYPYTE